MKYQDLAGVGYALLLIALGMLTAEQHWAIGWPIALITAGVLLAGTSIALTIVRRRATRQ